METTSTFEAHEKALELKIALLQQEIKVLKAGLNQYKRDYKRLLLTTMEGTK